MPTDYLYKTAPYKHQEAAFLKYRDREYHAHLWEMRVGKTKISIDTCAWLYSQGKIDAVFIIAPNGVHLEWADQIPEHCPDQVYPQVGIWVSSPNATQKKALKDFTGNAAFGLKFLCMNIDAVNTEKGRAFATSYLQAFRCMFILDEGSIIRNCDAQRTKAIIGDRGRKGLAALAPYRRLLNGTPITQSPLDLFPQFLMLDEYILGTSHVAFRNRYAIIELQGRMTSEIKKRLEKISATFSTYPWGELVTSHEEKAVTSGSQPLEDGSRIDFIVKMAGRMVYNMEWRRVQC